MIIGVPKETKNQEHRVGMVPAGVRALTSRGHQVLIQEKAGIGCGINDSEFAAVGAQLIPTAETVYERAEMIVKVKEPLPPEYPLLREDQILFTFLHLAPAPQLTRALLNSKTVGIAYETIQLQDGSLPLLAPMSEVAGRLSVQAGAHHLETAQGGRGQLLGGVPGTHPGKVTIVGGGSAGLNAARMAVGLGAQVTILDIEMNRLRHLDDIFRGRVALLASSEYAIRQEISTADLVIGAVLLPGARTPHLISRDMLREMQAGSVIVDIAVDQGGCVESTRPTTHDEPTYVEDGVIHYCVANMPSAVARTSTYALTNTTLPYAVKLADMGWKAALASDPALSRGLNVFNGEVACGPVAESINVTVSKPHLT